MSPRKKAPDEPEPLGGTKVALSVLDKALADMRKALEDAEAIYDEERKALLGEDGTDDGE